MIKLVYTRNHSLKQISDYSNKTYWDCVEKIKKYTIAIKRLVLSFHLCGITNMATRFRKVIKIFPSMKT